MWNDVLLSFDRIKLAQEQFVSSLYTASRQILTSLVDASFCTHHAPRISQYLSSFPMSLIRYICGRVELHYRAKDRNLFSSIVFAISVLEIGSFGFVAPFYATRELTLQLLSLKSS